jgi:hypothetical protein
MCARVNVAQELAEFAHCSKVTRRLHLPIQIAFQLVARFQTFVASATKFRHGGSRVEGVQLPFAFAERGCGHSPSRSMSECKCAVELSECFLACEAATTGPADTVALRRKARFLFFLNFADSGSRIEGFVPGKIQNLFLPVSLLPFPTFVSITEEIQKRRTFTVCAALLRQAGSGPVFPVALAQTSKTDET